jgi:hypothetical protein
MAALCALGVLLAVVYLLRHRTGSATPEAIAGRRAEG